jgi:hypothetical protein
MKISRNLLSYAGVVGLVSLSQVALAQTAAPDAPAADTTTPSPSAPVAAETTAPAGDSAAATATVDLAAKEAAAPTPVPLVEAAPTAPAAEKAEVFPKKLAAAKKGFLQIGTLAQAWYIYERADALAVDGDSGKTISSTNTFRIRRAQLKLSGAIVPDTVEFLVLADFAKTLKPSSTNVTGADGNPAKLGYYGSGQDSSPLLDFNFTLKSEYVDFTMGQWKSPISYEGGTSSAELIFPERSHASRYFGDNYDLGARLEKKLKYVKYSFQVLQGHTANTADNNKQKDLALRLEFYPFEGFFVGGAGLASVGQRDTQRSTREIVEVDAGYDNNGILLRGEMLWGKKGASNDDVERVSSRGMSITGAYTIAKTIQPAFRFGMLDVDQTLNPAELPLVSKFNYKTDSVRSYEFGLNYFIEGKNAKLMAAYGYLDFDSVPDVVFNPRHQVTFAAQFAY